MKSPAKYISWLFSYAIFINNLCGLICNAFTILSSECYLLNYLTPVQNVPTGVIFIFFQLGVIMKCLTKLCSLPLLSMVTRSQKWATEVAVSDSCSSLVRQDQHSKLTGHRMAHTLVPTWEDGLRPAMTQLYTYSHLMQSTEVWHLWQSSGLPESLQIQQMQVYRVSWACQRWQSMIGHKIYNINNMSPILTWFS